MQNKIYQKLLKRVVIFAASLFFSLPGMSFAQSGDYLLELDDFQISIWDASGSYFESAAGGDMSFTLSQDSKGKITGYGNLSISGSSISLDIKGTFKARNNVVRVKFSMKGKGYYQGVKVTLSASVSGELNEDTGCIGGTIKIKACARGMCASDSTSYYECLGAGMNGETDLDFYADPVDVKGKKLEGHGTVTLSNGDTYDFHVKGTYNSKKLESKFTLKGSDESSKGCTFKLIIDEGIPGTPPSSINGKMLGQKVKYKE